MRQKKTKQINLPTLPGGWNAMTLKQFRLVEDIHGKYASSEAYLANCFLALEGLKPLRHAERWRSFLSGIPFIKRFVADTGRQVARIYKSNPLSDESLVSWKQCYQFKGFWNSLFGKRFFMEDQELLYFQKKINFLTKRDNIYMVANPVMRKRAGLRLFRSYYTQLADMPWQNYRLCCMHIQNYTATRQETHLNAFLSTLYQPQGKVSDWLTKLTGREYPEDFTSYFTPLELNLILLFWNGTQQYYKKCFKHLFNNKGEERERDFLKEQAEITVFLSKEIGTIPQKAQEIEAFFALQYLEDNAILQEEKKKEIEKMKRMR